MGFWERQFDSDSTPKQVVFDVAFGILLPLFCLVADPVVFKSFSSGHALAGRFALFAYLQVFAGTTLLTSFLLRRRPSPILVGGLLAGAAFSFALGAFLLPFSLIGVLFMGLGLLGLSPLLSGFVFLRSAVRAWRGVPNRARPMPYVTAAAGLLAILLAPALAQVGADRIARSCIEKVLVGQATEGSIAALELLRFTHDLDLDRIVMAYGREPEGARKQAIARDYMRITGRPIDARLASILD